MPKPNQVRDRRSEKGLIVGSEVTAIYITVNINSAKMAKLLEAKKRNEFYEEILTELTNMAFESGLCGDFDNVYRIVTESCNKEIPSRIIFLTEAWEEVAKFQKEVSMKVPNPHLMHFIVPINDLLYNKDTLPKEVDESAKEGQERIDSF